MSIDSGIRSVGNSGVGIEGNCGSSCTLDWKVSPMQSATVAYPNLRMRFSLLLYKDGWLT